MLLFLALTRPIYRMQGTTTRACENIPTLRNIWHHATLERLELGKFHALRPRPPVLRGNVPVPVALAPTAAATRGSLDIAVQVWSL